MQHITDNVRLQYLIQERHIQLFKLGATFGMIDPKIVEVMSDVPKKQTPEGQRALNALLNDLDLAINRWNPGEEGF